MQTLQAYIQRYQGHTLLPNPQAPRTSPNGPDPTGTRLPGVQAIVAAFSLDERTVGRWQTEAGAQCRRVHERLVEAGQVDLGEVQADELRVKAVGGVLWLAAAIEVAEADCGWEGR